MINSSDDLLLDVVRAADPTKFREGISRLERAQNSRASSTSFASILANRAQDDDVAPIYKKYEGSVLKSFVNNMFTTASNDYYGSGVSGQMWKSMLSDTVANQLSKAGGIGIAKMLQNQANARSHKISSLFIR